MAAANDVKRQACEQEKKESPPRGSNSQPSDQPSRVKSLTLYPIELGGHVIVPEGLVISLFDGSGQMDRHLRTFEFRNIWVLREVM
jgi:hypothetical protein